jgi:hypothetical protein
MKISKSYLHKIIKEELQECMNDAMMAPEMPMGYEGGESGVKTFKLGKAPAKSGGDYEYAGRMTKSNLYNMAKHAMMLHDILQDNENVEPWVEEKIAVATDAMETVAEYMEYEKVRGN